MPVTNTRFAKVGLRLNLKMVLYLKIIINRKIRLICPHHRKDSGTLAEKYLNQKYEEIKFNVPDAFSLVKFYFLPR